MSEALDEIRKAHQKWRNERGGIGFACFGSHWDQDRAFKKADDDFIEAVEAALRGSGPEQGSCDNSVNEGLYTKLAQAAQALGEK